MSDPLEDLLAARAGQAAAPSPPAAPRAVRNNNGGNLRWDGKSQWQGMTGVDPDGFVQFDTPENGDRALQINLANQPRLHGINTVRAAITKYAPPTDHNDTASYIAHVSQQLGVGPDDQIDMSDPRISAAMAGVIKPVEAGAGMAAAQPSPSQQADAHDPLEALLAAQADAPAATPQSAPDDAAPPPAKSDEGWGSYLLHGASDAGVGFGKGLVDVAGTAGWGVDKLAGLAGLDLGLQRLADNQQEKLTGHQYDPNGWGSALGRFAGDTAGAAAVTGGAGILAPALRIAPETPALVRALKMAGQGAIGGAAVSGGHDVGLNAAGGAIAAPVIGAAADKLIPPALRALDAAKATKLAQALRKALPGAADDAAAADVGTADAIAAPKAPPTIARGSDIPADGTRHNGALRVNIEGGVREQPKVDWTQTVDRLKTDQAGDAPGALSHPDIGPIDVMWGNKDGGLAHIAAKHPEVVDQLPDLIPQMDVTSRTPNRIQLETPDHHATVRLDYDGQKKTWLLTAFKKDASGTAEDGLANAAGPEVSPAPEAAPSIPPAAASSNPLSDEQALIKALGSRGARRGLGSVADLPPEVKATYDGLIAKGVDPAEALREADIRGIGGEPTYAMVTRNRSAQAALREGAKADTDDGRALADALSRANAAPHQAAREMVERYGGIPAQGEAAEAAARVLAADESVMQRGVSQRYAEAEKAEGPAKVESGDLYAFLGNPYRAGAINRNAQTLVAGLRKRLDMFTGNKGDPKQKLNTLDAHSLEHLRKAAIDAYDEVGSPELRGIIHDWTNLIDDHLSSLGDIGPTYAKARAAHAKYAGLYKDPEGLAALIRRNDRGEFLNADRWRQAEDKLLGGGKNDRNAAQVIKRLRDLPDGHAAIDRMKATVIQQAYERATRSAADETGNSTFNGKMFADGITNRLGEARMAALFDKGEIAQIASLARAATAINEPVPGTLNTSNTASALARIQSAMKETPKKGVMEMVGHGIATAVHPGAGNVAVHFGSKMASGLKKAAQDKAMSEAVAQELNPAAGREGAVKFADALRRRERSHPVSSRSAPASASATAAALRALSGR